MSTHIQKILVTGGAGYIGSHTILELLFSGHHVVVLDNLSNSSVESLVRVSKIAGKSFTFVEGDIRDSKLLKSLFCEHAIDSVLHFAGLKAVGESVLEPLRYYENNVCGSQLLLQAMAVAGVFKIVFSSSATVYGDPENMPVSEVHPVCKPMSPYGRSKLMVESILQDLAISDERWSIAILRYFNPVGAHDSGLIGEDPNGTPNNLLPYIAQVAVGKLPELTIFGSDYPTHDGTGVRDYIHVVDLAEGHLRALEALTTRAGTHVWNLGTGQGYSVLDVVHAFEVVSGMSVPYRIAPRRAGDIAACYANPIRAANDLGWRARRGLLDMMLDTWRWQQMNPSGYR
jgi:UDP-glucose 4-epimerase